MQRDRLEIQTAIEIDGRNDVPFLQKKMMNKCSLRDRHRKFTKVTGIGQTLTATSARCRSLQPPAPPQQPLVPWPFQALG
jgi:hypothetical protein